jgi:hypothetical protein
MVRPVSSRMPHPAVASVDSNLHVHGEERSFGEFVSRFPEKFPAF